MANDAQLALESLIETGLLLETILNLVTIQKRATPIWTGSHCSTNQKFVASQKQVSLIETGPLRETEVA